ncbi:Lrp/AsnC family transcriptional regulator [Mesobacillus jeotgali]|uniref:Lrp/AsnC family transcriptional regulator n=1 Tax=Mesobacillus jeotgali TaxID=129985 RepID=UPI0009A6F042|nr:Lrp/AsnC family transcriptional regulator [Mesobacillus jeotgali]
MLDQTDNQILDELSRNSRIKMKELGEKVHLTAPAASARIAKLEDSGVIEGYTIKLNHTKMGFFIHAFITVLTQSIHHQPYLDFLKGQEKYQINHYKISGGGCYLLECKFPSNEIMNLFLEELNQYANYKLSIVIKKS